MKFKATILSNMDGYQEEEGQVWDVYEVLIKAKSRTDLERIKKEAECIIEIKE